MNGITKMVVIKKMTDVVINLRVILRDWEDRQFISERMMRALDDHIVFIDETTKLDRQGAHRTDEATILWAVENPRW